MKKNLRMFLMIFFSLIMVTSLGILAYSLFAPKEDVVFLSEIIVNEEDKVEIPVEEEVLSLAPDVDIEQIRHNYGNHEIIGRLEIPNLFNVLVTKTSDNSFYLEHSIYRKKDPLGTEFMDFRVMPTSKQINIYGHNSRDKSLNIPFLRLENFLDKNFFDENPYIVFQHDSGKSIYKITAIKEVTTDEHMNVSKTGDDFVKHVDFFRKNAIHTRDVSYNQDSDIIILQTCSHHLDNAYYLLVGIKI